MISGLQAARPDPCRICPTGCDAFDEEGEGEAAQGDRLLHRVSRPSRPSAATMLLSRVWIGSRACMLSSPPSDQALIFCSCCLCCSQDVVSTARAARAPPVSKGDPPDQPDPV